MEAHIEYPLRPGTYRGQHYGGKFTPQWFPVANYFAGIISLNLYDELADTQVRCVSLAMSPSEARTLSLALPAISEGALEDLEGRFHQEQ